MPDDFCGAIFRRGSSDCAWLRLGFWLPVKPLGPGLSSPGLDLPGEDPGIFAVSDPAERELPGLLCGHEIHGACHGETLDGTHCPDGS